MYVLSDRELSKELKAAIDVLSDAMSPVRDPKSYAFAYRDLLYLISDPERWASIFKVREGAKSNYVLHDLGKTRMDFLNDFYKREVKG